jgi:hypothetical protein
MVFQQRATAEADAFSVVPPAVAEAAARYQRFREIEKEHLERMARHNLLADWTAEVRATVLEARERIREARAARELFRQQVREFVCALRAAREPLPGVLRHTRSMVQLLENAGAIERDDGWLEAEVLEWAIEEFDRVA